MGSAEEIQKLLAVKPGLKAKQPAAELGLARPQVMATVHGFAGEVVRDSACRWWPKTRRPRAEETAPGPRTLLASLCRYYLECLSRESGPAISVPAGETAAYALL